MEGIKSMLACYQAWRKRPAVRLAVTLAAVLASALVQCYAIQVFVRQAGIISGGFCYHSIYLSRDNYHDCHDYRFSYPLGSG